MSETTVTPEVLWAQRSSTTDPTKNFVYLTLTIPDVAEKDLKLDIQPTKIVCSGHSHTKKTTYSVDFELFGEIVPEETKKNHTDRDLELVLRKKELNLEFWPRLLKEKGKVHFLRTDFDRWVDEDEQEGNPDDEDMMNKMGGMGGMGGGAGGPGMGGAGGFEGIDFSKLGAGGGMGGMPGMGGMGGLDGDMGEEESDDDEDEGDMPELEGEENSKAGAAEPAKSSKIEEVE